MTELDTNPLVSIIIPMYNAEEYISETLECVLKQTYKNKEIILVNDGSTDNSLEIAQRFESDKLKILNQENQGGNMARNKGLMHAKGKYIQFWDADDLMSNDKILLQVKRLKKEPAGTMATCSWYRFYNTPGDFDHGTSPNWIDFDKPMDWVKEYLCGRAMMPVHGWLTPAVVLRESGLWNTKLKINQDGEFFCRVILKSHRLVYINDASVYYRSGLMNSISQSSTAKKQENLFYSMQLIIQHVLKKENTPEVRNAIACYLHKFVKATYISNRRLSQEVENFAYEFGKCPADTSFGQKPSMLYHRVEQLLGWKMAARLKQVFGF